RRLPHHGAQDSREVEADLVTNLRLVDSGQVVLDRVLRGDDLDVGTIELLERRVEGRRLSGAGRPGDEEDAVRPLDDLLEALVVGLVETQLLEVDEAILLVEDSHDDALAVSSRESADAKVDIAPLSAHLDASVLRAPLLRHVHPGHDLDAGDDRALELLRRVLLLDTDAVDPIADSDALLEGLDVDVARALLDGVRDQLRHIFDDRRVVGLAILARVLIAADLDLLLVAKDRAQVPGALVVVLDRLADVLGRRDRGLDLLIEEETEVVEDRVIERLHRDDQGAVAPADRHDVVLDRHIARHGGQKLLGELAHLGEIRERQLPMLRERSADDLLVDTQADQSLANPAVMLLGIIQRLLDLLVRDRLHCFEDLSG